MKASRDGSVRQPVDRLGPAHDEAGPAAALVHRLARRLGAELIETHISWVLLAGELAYKVKKPVRLPFVDYGTLAAREHFCAEELRLNQRLAPGLYLGLSRVTGTPAEPALDGSGPLLEVAVRMRRFAQEDLFSARAAAGSLDDGDVDALAGRLAAFHAQAPVCPAESGFGTPALRRDAALAALEGAGQGAGNDWQERMRSWLTREAEALAPLWARRLGAGRVRGCHGDLHLDNIVLQPDGVAAFDCIEFEPALRWIDVLDDVAFAVMDLDAHERGDLAFRLLNAWLDRLGEHDAVAALRFSVVYRALVRAQVARLRADPARTAVRRYLDTADAWTRHAPARLWITHGLPGSGKSFHSQRLLEQQRAIRLRSDVERKRLFGLQMLDDSRAAGLALYTPEVTRRTYDRLFAGARTALRAGFSVVLDAAFLRRAEREQARQLAEAEHVPFNVLVCRAPADVLQERLRSRRDDPSEADAAVLDKLRSIEEPLTADEERRAIPAEKPGPLA